MSQSVTVHDVVDGVPAFETMPLSDDLRRDLRSDHAGETGAVWIYRGILAVSRHRDVRRFAREHLRAERTHLEFFETWLPAAWHSRLAPLWRVAGFLLGALPALVGRRAVFRTIEAVERFVEDHYQDQIRQLESDARLRPLAAELQKFCDEEVEHCRDAAQRAQSAGSSRPGLAARLWMKVVGIGSVAGVFMARLA